MQDLDTPEVQAIQREVGYLKENLEAVSNMKRALQEKLDYIQANCSHHWVKTGEGNNGWDLEYYFTCTICGKEK